MNELIFFSNNKFKIREVKQIFVYKKIKVLTLKDFPKVKEPNESWNSFNENAIIKSEFGYKQFGLPCFADDSGICISALDNQPGVHSKRFKQKIGSYKKTFQKIINATKKKNDFKAFFQTTIALTTNTKNTICFEGIVKGKISNKPIGIHGFHYDPIFIPEGSTNTFAEMDPEEKNKISHRAIAVKKLKNFLEKLFW